MRANYFKNAFLGLILSVFFQPVFPQINFSKHHIASPDTPSDVYSADINDDGFVDILTVSRDNGGNVVWWMNNGNGAFESKQVVSGFASPRSVRAGDIDSDGDMDIIACAWVGNKITWWENDGEESFTANNVVTGWVGPHTVELCDLDQDGDIDILCSQFDNTASMSEIAWWENDGSQQWTKHVVSSRFQQSPFVYGDDMDNDGDIDLIGCGELNGEVCLWENDGEENWAEYVIDNQFSKAHTILARDFDKDGDMDILAHACTSSLQAWYENKGNKTFSKKTMEDLGGAIYMDCADFDMDGDFDLIATGMGAEGLVCYENDGRQELTRRDVQGPMDSGFALNITDVDGDGDQDVIAVGYNSNTLAWWENTTERTSHLNSPKWIDYDDTEGVMYVSNEEDGSLVRFYDSGSNHCIRNSLPICTGLEYKNGALWVAVGISIYKLDPVSGASYLSFRLPAQFIQGLTLDDSGFIYSSDPYSGIVFKSDPETGQTMILTSGLDYPQSIKFDPGMNKLVLLDGEQVITIKIIDPETGEISTTLETQIIPGGDIIPDGLGNHYVSSPEEDAVYAVTRNFTDPFYLYAQDLFTPTGLVYYSDDQTLGYLSPELNSLEVIPANATGVAIAETNKYSDVKIYPNPVRNILNISGIEGEATIRIFSLQGELLRTIGNTECYNISDLPPAVYVIDIELDGVSIRERFVKR